ncbi:MAG: RtcB family protein, partial [Treponema sp.]|nr:RtcB family protein [Treponema sp.]
MQTVTGKFNSAKVFTDVVEEKSIQQIQLLCDQEFTEGAKIRMMPDVHAGAGCTIGTTMTIKDKIVPNLVGVDIGCGMETLMIHKDSDTARNFDPAKLDKSIRKNIPSGFDIRKFMHDYVAEVEWDKIKGTYNKHRAKLSLGTLGGGNHFIEADRDQEGNLYIVVHSGSRHAGLEIAEYYQEEAWKQMNGKSKSDIEAMIERLKSEGRENEIEENFAALKSQVKTSVPKDLAYVSGYLFDDYINDMRIMQHFAMLNRKAMINSISIGLRLKREEIVEQFTTIHNYIDTENMILRKGAVSAMAGEKLLIPINMRDGSLICIGKGNEDWNCSAPHGAGRIMSRSKARKELSMDEFKSEMSGIYSTTVSKETLDEA